MNIPIRIQLSPLLTISILPADSEGGPVGFSQANLRDLTTHLLNEFSPKFGHAKIRALAEGEYVYPNEGTVVSKVHRISREPTGFASAFAQEAAKLADELRLAEPFDGMFVVEARFSDEAAFSPENMFRDYLYVYARLIKKKG